MNKKIAIINGRIYYKKQSAGEPVATWYAVLTNLEV